MLWVGFAFLCLAAATSGQNINDHDQVVACYVSSWAVYRPGKGQFMIDNVDPTLCTHLIYAFAGIDENTFRMKSLDPEYDINKGGFNKAVSLKLRNPRLKVTLAVGGWIEGSVKYSNMASTRANRKAFIDSAIELLEQYRFDGLDLDWEYPANRGGKPEDRDNFSMLVKELKEAFRGRNWLLTAAVGAGQNVVDTAYDIPTLSQYLDYIHLMAYDYHGKWDLFTGHNAPLYARADEQGLETSLNVNHSVRYYLNKGLPTSKFVLGLGVYGRTFLLNNTANPGIGAPAMKSAFSGPYTREDGFLGYNEICEKQTTERGWSIAWQSAHQAPYMFKGKMWVSFDDHNSLGLKVAFSQRLGLAGVMVWSIDTDDFRGECGQVRFPLLKAINRNLALHASNRFEERIPTTGLPIAPSARPVPGSVPESPITPIQPARPVPGIPLPDRPVTPVQPHVPVPGVPLPDSPHSPFVPLQPHTPTDVRTGVPLPGLPPRQPDVSVPVQPSGIPVQPVDVPLQPIDIPRQPDAPRKPVGVPLPEVPTHPDYPTDGLDADKPGRAPVDFDVNNDLHNARYYPAEPQSGATTVTLSTGISLLVTLLAFFSLNH